MRDPEYTKKLIISKALPIFNTKGYSATSISDITKATGITKGAIYGNFENKDAVAVAVFQHASDIIIGHLAKKIESAPTAPLKLRAICEYYGEYSIKPPIEGGCPIINTSIEADDNHPLLRTKVVRLMTVVKNSLIKIINRGIRENQIKKDINVEEFAHEFYAAIQGAIMMSRVEGDTVSYNHVKSRLNKQIDNISV